MHIERAIKLLKAEYERAKKLEYVLDPTAFALYRVWQEAERLRVERQQRLKKDQKELIKKCFGGDKE